MLNINYMQFIKKVFELLGKIVVTFLEANLSLLEDLKSFRNKLVFFTCALTVLIILLDRDYRVMLAALGLFEFFICYYFYIYFVLLQKANNKKTRC